jgi:hypothetical protein
MDKNTLDSLKSWFSGYVASFYTGGKDTYLDEHYRLKEDHTYLVCSIARRIAEGLSLSDGDVNLAEATGLLHDTGRFEQFRQYRTYKDPESVDHCQLGVEVLRKENVAALTEPADWAILEKTVEVHGKKELPAGLDERTALFCKLIRDADKVDIFRVLAVNFRRYYADPKRFPLEVEFADKAEYSPEIVERLRRRQSIDYRCLKTLLDAKLLTLGWIYDINFAPTLELIRADGWWDELLGYIPDLGELKELKTAMRTYLHQKPDRSD